MIIITDNKESKKIDELLINEYNIPEIVLMANAGMGDLLFGMISSYYAQGYSNINATIYGAYIHAKYGRDLSKEHNVVNPSMILNEM